MRNDSVAGSRLQGGEGQGDLASIDINVVCNGKSVMENLVRELKGEGVWVIGFSSPADSGTTIASRLGRCFENESRHKRRKGKSQCCNADRAEHFVG